MSRKIKMKCSQEQFESIHEAVDGTRKGTEYVKVPRQALVNLLIDHGELQNLFEKETERSIGE